MLMLMILIIIIIIIIILCDVAKRDFSDKKILKVIFVKVGLKECFLELREITVQKV